MAKYSFKTDTQELKQWLGKRKQSLEQARLPFEGLWRDIRLHFDPSLGKALLEGDPNDRDAKRDDERIYNSEPRILLQRLGAGLQSGITNQARAWFSLEVDGYSVGKTSKSRGWLDYATERVGTTMQRSNAYSALDQIYTQLGQFGTAAALVFRDDEADLHVDVCDCGSYYLAQNRRQRVDVLMRKKVFTLAQLIEEFGEGWLPDRLRESQNMTGALESWHDVWHIVCPVEHLHGLIKDLAPKMRFASVYWLDGYGSGADSVGDGNQGVLAIRGFPYNPIIAPRWTLGSSVYGYGPAFVGLADSKELQRLEKDKLKLVEQEVDPSMLADASMKGIPINTGPGGVTYANFLAAGLGQASAVPVRRLFETSNQIEAVLLAIQSVEERLRRIFYSDLFALLINLNLNPTQKTATEVMELQAEKVALLGPVLTRLNTDLLDPLVNAVYEVVLETEADRVSDSRSLSLLSPPDALAGRELKIKYVSSLHVEQQSATRLGGLQKLLEFAGGVAQFMPEALDKIDADKVIDVAAASLVEHGVVRDQKDVDEMRMQRAQAQAAMEQAQALKQQTAAVKDVAQADQAMRSGGGGVGVGDAGMGMGGLVE